MKRNRGIRGMRKWERRERWKDIGCGTLFVLLALSLLARFIVGIL